MFAVEWHGSKSSAVDNNGVGKYQLIGNGSITRTIHCSMGAAVCDPVIIFLTNVVDYKLYFFQVSRQLSYFSTSH
jgi:hypothetical protein